MSDLISRQAVVDALEKVAGLYPWRVPGDRDSYSSYNEAWQDALNRAENEIEALPAAQTNLDHIYEELSRAYNVPGLPKEAIGIIGDLMVSLDEPPIQPTEEFQWCDDCKEYDKQRHCCPRWNRVIRQAVEELEEYQAEEIEKYRNYQIEWLTSHNDLELDPVVEGWVVRFLTDTAEMYKTER